MNNPFQQGLYPISHISDCNYNHYALQLNMYKYYGCSKCECLNGRIEEIKND